MNDKLRILFNGIIAENPTFVLMLGMCPTLGTTGSAINGMSMGLATMAVLICSNVVISLIKNFVPSKVRIPAYIVVIAAFVSVLQLVMEAYVPSLYATLGIFIPLIVVNCIVLGRAEAFASRHSVFDSCLDGIGIGLGFQSPSPFSAQCASFWEQERFLISPSIPNNSAHSCSCSHRAHSSPSACSSPFSPSFVRSHAEPHRHTSSLILKT